MRELILKMSISIDGFVSDVDGGNRWMFGGDQKAKNWSVATLRDAGLHIMGSRTFLSMASYWPTSTDMFAPPMNGIPKAVFSRREPSDLMREADAGRSSPEAQPGAGSWAEAYVATGDLADEIARLKAVAGKAIIAHGGAGFARSLVAGGLVDRYVLLVHPTALGKGAVAIFRPRRADAAYAGKFDRLSGWRGRAGLYPLISNGRAASIRDAPFPIRRQAATSIRLSPARRIIAFCSFSNARTSIWRTRSRLTP